MTQFRMERLESLMKEELSDIISREMADSGAGLITITKILFSKDLQHTKVFVSIYAEEAKQKKAMRKLKQASGFIKGIIGQRIRMRYVPEINFIQDRSLEEASRIFEIMQDLKEKRSKKD